MSDEPTTRAMQRIEALIERGTDPIRGTLQRLAAVTKAEKAQGIYYAALEMAERTAAKSGKQQWAQVAAEAKKKHRLLQG